MGKRMGKHGQTTSDIFRSSKLANTKAHFHPLLGFSLGRSYLSLLRLLALPSGIHLKSDPSEKKTYP